MILTAVPGVLIVSYQVFYGLLVWNGVCWDDSVSGGLLTSGMLVWDYLNGITGVQRELTGFPGDSVVKKRNPPATTGDAGSTPGSGRSRGKENGNPLQYSCLGNPMDRRAWQMTVHGVTKESDMT